MPVSRIASIILQILVKDLRGIYSLKDKKQVMSPEYLTMFKGFSVTQECIYAFEKREFYSLQFLVKQIRMTPVLSFGDKLYI